VCLRTEACFASVALNDTPLATLFPINFGVGGVSAIPVAERPRTSSCMLASQGEGYGHLPAMPVPDHLCTHPPLQAGCWKGAMCTYLHASGTPLSPRTQYMYFHQQQGAAAAAAAGAVPTPLPPTAHLHPAAAAEAAAGAVPPPLPPRAHLQPAPAAGAAEGAVPTPTLTPPGPDQAAAPSPAPALAPREACEGGQLCSSSNSSSGSSSSMGSTCPPGTRSPAEQAAPAWYELLEVCEGGLRPHAMGEASWEEWARQCEHLQEEEQQQGLAGPGSPDGPPGVDAGASREGVQQQEGQGQGQEQGQGHQLQGQQQQEQQQQEPSCPVPALGSPSPAPSHPLPPEASLPSSSAANPEPQPPKWPYQERICLSGWSGYGTPPTNLVHH